MLKKYNSDSNENTYIYIPHFVFLAAKISNIPMEINSDFNLAI